MDLTNDFEISDDFNWAKDFDYDSYQYELNQLEHQLGILYDTSTFDLMLYMKIIIRVDKLVHQKRLYWLYQYMIKSAKSHYKTWDNICQEYEFNYYDCYQENYLKKFSICLDRFMKNDQVLRHLFTELYNRIIKMI